MGPDVGAAGGGADREVLVESDPEARAPPPLRRGGELAVELELQPAVEVHRSRVLGSEPRAPRASRGSR